MAEFFVNSHLLSRTVRVHPWIQQELPSSIADSENSAVFFFFFVDKVGDRTVTLVLKQVKKKGGEKMMVVFFQMMQKMDWCHFVDIQLEWPFSFA